MGLLEAIGLAKKSDLRISPRTAAAKTLVIVAELGTRWDDETTEIKYKESWDIMKDVAEKLCSIRKLTFEDGILRDGEIDEVCDKQTPEIDCSKVAALSPKEFVALYPELKEPFAAVAKLVKEKSDKDKKAESKESDAEVKVSDEKKETDETKSSKRADGSIDVAAIANAVVESLMKKVEKIDEEADSAKRDMGRPRKDQSKPAEPVKADVDKKDTAKKEPAADKKEEPKKTDAAKEDKPKTPNEAADKKADTNKAPEAATAKQETPVKVKPVITDAIKEPEAKSNEPSKPINPATATPPAPPVTTTPPPAPTAEKPATEKPPVEKKPIEESKEEFYVPKGFKLGIGVIAGMKLGQLPIFNRMLKKLDRQAAFIKAYPDLDFTSLEVHITSGEKKFATYVFKDAKGRYVEIFYNTGVPDNKKNISIGVYADEKGLLDQIKVRETNIAAEQDTAKKAELSKLLYHYVPKAA